MLNQSSSKIAVLLAAYNGEKYIADQLDSIIEQRNISLAVIISVDKCNDNTLSIVNRYASNHPELFTILPYGKTYGSAGKNFIRLLCDVDLTPYQYVSFADQDDIWFPDKLSRAVAEMQDKNADGYSSNVTAFWESGKTKLVNKSFSQTPFDFLFESPGPGCTFLFSNALAKSMQAHLLSQSNKLDSIWLHDWYCYSYARFNGFRWYIDPIPSMYYRQHGSNEVGANFGWKSFVKRLGVILTGDGFDKVSKQAAFIGQEASLPIKLLNNKNRISMLRLLMISWQCRRQPLHKVMMSMACLIFFIKGFPSKGRY